MMSDFQSPSEIRLNERDEDAMAINSGDDKIPAHYHSQWSSSELSPDENDYRQQYKENTSPIGAASLKSIPNTRHSDQSIRQRHVVFTPTMNQRDYGKDTTSVEAESIFRQGALLENVTYPPSLSLHKNLEQETFSDLAAEQSFASAPTDLHSICRNLSTLDDVLRARSILNGEIGRLENIASKKDESGSTALHVFSSNKTLSAATCGQHEFEFESSGYLRLQQHSTFDTIEPESNFQKQGVQFLINDLLAAFPPAMMIRDEEGFIPFQNGLVDWVHSCQSSVRCATSDKSFRRSSAMGQVWESTSTTFRSAMKRAKRNSIVGSGTKNSGRDLEGGHNSRGQRFSPNNKDEFDSESKMVGHCRDRNFPTLVRLSPHARFTLIMLSAVTDQLDLYKSSKAFPSPRCGGYRTEMDIINFKRAKAELKNFRRVYGSVDITLTIVQTGKSFLEAHESCTSSLGQYLTSFLFSCVYSWFNGNHSAY
jgi:hypothetical protein